MGEFPVVTDPHNRILYIEDDETLCDLFKVAVEAHGHSVDVAMSGEDGLALHASKPYDLIATDHQLPDITGLDIARKLLAEDSSLPIIMVTGRGREQIAAEALALGVCNYVIKDNEKTYLDLLPNIIGSALKRSADHHNPLGVTNFLKDAMEGMSEGILYFNADDQLILANKSLKEMYPLAADVFVHGVSYEECMRKGVERGEWGPQNGEDKEEWIQDRLTYHYDPEGSYEFILLDGRTIRIEEKKTPQGGIVGIRADITEVKKIEAQVRESEEHLRGIMDTAVDGIITIDKRGAVNSFNRAAQGMFGYSAEEVIGKNVKILMPSPYARQHDNFVHNYVRGGHAQIIGIGREVIGQRKDGSTFPMDLDVSELRLGDRVDFTGIIRDITKRKKAESLILESEEKYRNLFNNATEGFVRTTPQGQFTDVNPAFARMLGYASAEELIREVSDIGKQVWVNHEDRQAMIDSLKANDISEVKIETSLRRKDGRIICVILAMSLIRDAGGKLIGLDAIVEDITKRKKYEEETIKLNEKLEQRVEERTRELESANHAKSQFLAAVSHELRTPLNAIIGFSQILVGEHFGPIGEKRYQEYAKDIGSSGEHLLSLVDDLLDISTIEAGKKSLDKLKLPIASIIAECAEIVQEKAKDGGIKLEIDTPDDLPPLYADLRATKQILLNLLTNSIKFTPKDGRVTISAKATKKNTTIKIADTGIGIPAERLPKLTNVFVRAESDAYVAEKGWGLGLSITKSLVELHGGKLDIKSEVGKGTTVTVALPNGAP